MEKRISSKQFLTDMFTEQYKKMMELYKTHEKSIADILHNILKKPSIGINKLSEQIPPLKEISQEKQRIWENDWQ